eukprot:CAMPEP_0172370024 /NCGR_PEP_ID=MMETSP1060-20121228/35776_1 /TAXON_ID=37318 /ORGANISM="Pseudo-nitzschia pungens, Strain cf. cingulata" /LENGTH=514 /DNA_ID=CAMNT_0013095157 /DNA_START=164 /DNA_END=1708 /DNA_ORIENTATION=+
MKISNSSNQTNQNNSAGTMSWILPVLVSSGISIATISIAGFWALREREKHLRSRWLEMEEKKEKDGEDDFGGDVVGQSLYSVIEHFKSLELSTQSTILEANRRRTTSYYEKAREAHEQSLVLGVPNYSVLLKKRQAELDRIMFYYNGGTKSLRTVIVMLDQSTQQVLSEARQKILQPLNYSWDVYSKGVWIPEINMIPKRDMHVSVACPWWWHTIREGNDELNVELSNRLKQALVIDFHHPFFLELERIILLGGKTLVALWRTVGERTVIEDGAHVVCDRHATTIDPMVRLRREILDCFTNEQHEHNFQPLTHQHRQNELEAQALGENEGNEAPTSKAEEEEFCMPKPGTIKRRHTIELKTPGLGSGDGFIHTTLCRLPLDCFSSQDVELEPIHRLCREATATYSGHRMLVHKFRFLETTGAGGDSNPCTTPLFDETMEAPSKVVPRQSTMGRSVSETVGIGDVGIGSDGLSNLERNALTTGRAHNLTLKRNADSTSATLSIVGGIRGLFEPPK